MSAGATPRPLSVHIDRLVIDPGALGTVQLDARARASLQAALQTELAALLAQAGGGHGLGAAGAVDALRGPAPSLAPGAGVAELGRAVAGAVARTLNAERRP